MNKKEKREQKQQHKDDMRAQAARKVMMQKIGFAVLLVGIVLGIVALVIATKKDASDIADIHPNPAKGGAEASVVIKEYSDFQCPACKAMSPVLKEIIKKYGDKIRFEYNHYPLPQHTYAMPAAIASQCVYEQKPDQFFAYHDTLFENQGTWESAADKQAANEYFTTYAKELDVKIDAFKSCIASSEAEARIQEDITEAQTLGVNSTPTFFVNGKMLTKTPYAAELQKEIDAILAEQQ